MFIFVDAIKRKAFVYKCPVYLNSILPRLAHEGLQKKIKQVFDEVLSKIRNPDCIIRIIIMCQHFMMFMMA